MILSRDKMDFLKAVLAVSTRDQLVYAVLGLTMALQELTADMKETPENIAQINGMFDRITATMESEDGTKH